MDYVILAKQVSKRCATKVVFHSVFSKRLKILQHTKVCSNCGYPFCTKTAMEDSNKPVVVTSTSSPYSLHHDADSQRHDAESVACTMLLLDKKSRSRPSSLSNMEDDEKDNQEYVKKRARNNMAVKKSRDRSKKRIMETQERVEQLTQENSDLNQKVTLLSKELNVLRALFTNGGFTVPCNLQIVAQNPVNVGNKASSTSNNKAVSAVALAKMTTETNSNSKNHTSVIRSAASSAPCHGVILVTEPGKMNLDIQAGIQFKDESN